MKTIYFIRHAKSSWDDPMLSDKDRPLNSRGLRDAPFMAKHLSSVVSNVDAIISSPANRAFTTATYFATAFGKKASAIIVDEEIYEAFLTTIYYTIQALNNDWSTVLLFGHNPTLTMLANDFSDEFITNVPTCGIIEVVANIERWADFNANKGELTAFYYPKQFNITKPNKT